MTTSSVSEDYLERIVREFSLDVTCTRVIERGWDHVLVVVDERLAFRFPRSDHYRDVLVTEVRLLEHLRGTVNVPIPSYRYVAADGSFGGYPLLRGATMTAELLQARVPMAGREGIARELGLFLRLLHSVPVETAETLGVPRSIPNWRSSYYDLFRRSCEEHIYPRLTRPDIDRIESFIPVLEAARAQPYRAALCHSEIAPRHLLLDQIGDSVAGVIDFTDCAIADPAADLAGLWAYGREFARIAFDEYGDVPADRSFFYRSFQHYRQKKLVALINAVRHEGPVPGEDRFAGAYRRFQEAFATAGPPDPGLDGD
jgi:aminoglycoside phosphotransferase (APT) family kinase protein